MGQWVEGDVLKRGLFMYFSDERDRSTFICLDAA